MEGGNEYVVERKPQDAVKFRKIGKDKRSFKNANFVISQLNPWLIATIRLNRLDETIQIIGFAEELL